MIHEYIIKVDDDKKDIFGGMPLIDKPQGLVRCRECNKGCLEEGKINGFWCSKRKEWHDGDWFCADGERG